MRCYGNEIEETGSLGILGLLLRLMTREVHRPIPSPTSSSPAFITLTFTKGPTHTMGSPLVKVGR